MNRVDAGIKIVAAFIFMFGGVFWISWYQAGRQQAAYEKQGIQISQWDVWIGVKPPEITVHVGESRP